MTKSAKRIYAFLDDHFGEYRNRHGIEFHMSVEDSIFVIHAMNPPEPYANFGLLYPCNSFDNFVTDFKFERSCQLKTLESVDLWRLYYDGKIEVYCAIAAKTIFYTLHFRLSKNHSMIVRDDYDNEHTLNTILKSPYQFLDYTQNHFWSNQKNHTV